MGSVRMPSLDSASRRLRWIRNHSAEKVWAVTVSAVIVVLVAFPGLRMLVEDSTADGFPLSTYPMFTNDPGRIVELPTVVATGEDGAVERLSPQQIAGTDQVIQAAVTVQDAVRGGRSATAALCREVAARVERPSTTIAVVVERHDAIAWSGDPAAEPLSRRVVTTCEASR